MVAAVGRTLLMLLMLVSVAIPASATDPEVVAREIESLLMAPCCFRQQVSVHQSSAANEVRRDIRERLMRGETRQVILDAYVAEHGVGILAVPPAQGSTMVLYVLPPLVLAGSALLVAAFIQKFSESQVAVSQPVAVAAGDGALDARLTDELRDLD